MDLYKISNVTSGDLYSKMRRHKKDLDRHNIQKWQPCTLDRFPGVTVTYFDKDYISNVIGKNQLARLDFNSILVIIAQTGSGKTTWLFKTLLPWVLNKNPNKKILYLCSRNSLANQIKTIAMKDSLNSEIRVGDYIVKEKAMMFSPKGLQNEYDFGAFHIMTYQSYLNKCQKLNLNDYEYVIYDEAHYFLNDSTFNPFTEETLNTLTMHFRNKRKIILTATPLNALDVIWDKERAASSLFKPNMDVFFADEDYSYVNAKFFAKNEYIIEEILLRNKDYWIIFVTSKNEGAELEETLSKKGVNCKLITADTDKADEDYLDLIGKEAIPGSATVLITTRLLDVGINIKNPRMNIVTYELEVSEIKQMIGRKRISQDETINVYFYSPTIQELTYRSNGISKKLSEINKQIYAVDNDLFIEKLDHPFFYHGTEIKLNALCLKKLRIECNNYNRLIDYLYQFETAHEQNKAYAMFLLDHFDNINYSEENLFLKNPLEELMTLLKKYENTEMTKEEFQEFSGEIVDILGDPRARIRDNNPATNTINQILKKYNYTIKSNGQPVKYTLKKVGE